MCDLVPLLDPRGHESPPPSPTSRKRASPDDDDDDSTQPFDESVVVAEPPPQPPAPSYFGTAEEETGLDEALSQLPLDALTDTSRAECRETDALMAMLYDHTQHLIRSGVRLETIDELPLSITGAFAKHRDATTLAKRNPIDVFDKAIKFNAERHEYKIHGTLVEGSCTSFLDSFFDAFDAESNAQRIAATPNHKEYRDMTREQVLYAWDVNRDCGTVMHLCVELALNNELHPETLRALQFPVQPLQRDQPAYTHFRRPPASYARILCSVEMAQYYAYYREIVLGRRLVPFRTELRVADYSELGHALLGPSWLAGSVDMIYKAPDDPTGRMLVIHDWKRAKNLLMPEDALKIPFFAKKRGKGPCGDLMGCNGAKYTLQLSLYKYIIKRETSYDANGLSIVVMHPSLATYRCVDVPDLSEHIHAMVANRVRTQLLSTERKVAALQAQLAGLRRAEQALPAKYKMFPPYERSLKE